MRCDSSLKLPACVNLLLSIHYESEGVPYHVDQSLVLPARLRRRGGSEQEQQELQLARLEVGGARLAGRGTARAQYGDVMWKRVRPRGRGWPAVGRKPPSQPACPARQEVARPRRPAETAHTTNATPRQNQPGKTVAPIPPAMLTRHSLAGRTSTLDANLSGAGQTTAVQRTWYTEPQLFILRCLRHHLNKCSEARHFPN